MQIILRIIISVVVLLYPFLVYRGVQEGGVWFAHAVIAGIYFYQAVKTRKTPVRVQKLVIVLSLLVGTIFYQELVAKLIPIIIQLTLMLFFGKTLLKGKGPSLVERFARLDFPDQPMPLILVNYCRNLTLVWAGFFAFNVVTCVVLALFAPVEWWAVFTGVLIFLLSVLLMVAEYFWRHIYFRSQDLPFDQIPGFKDSARNMVVNGRKIWLDVQAS
ncbi:hypothetical protein BJAS_P1201 [Bathymodiolus japonicus methanotrophic gill symbiont]|uniref:COG4648 family protein n=1 Tax=Bathymodiolus japonicus methanotrophic gill symbiont TaxID=113269 RepID=UPI001B456C56|nr:hypothetical protein [Bathymodiolus japonicus methanotrophic gill symbiont]GFO71586.1 hypothetical protein BJAS_P1201 [Bathymodiolus japonicus methanotrophic gill symbiont]